MQQKSPQMGSLDKILSKFERSRHQNVFDPLKQMNKSHIENIHLTGV